MNPRDNKNGYDLDEFSSSLNNLNDDNEDEITKQLEDMIHGTDYEEDIPGTENMLSRMMGDDIVETEEPVIDTNDYVNDNEGFVTSSYDNAALNDVVDDSMSTGNETYVGGYIDEDSVPSRVANNSNPIETALNQVEDIPSSINLNITDEVVGESVGTEEEDMIIPTDGEAQEEENEEDFVEGNFGQRLQLWKKILIVVGLIAVIGAIVAYVFIFSEDEEKIPPKPNKEEVVLEKENYVYKDGVLSILVDEEEVGTYKCNVKDEEKCFMSNEEVETKVFAPIYEYEDGSLVLRPSKVYSDDYIFVNDGEEELVSIYNMSTEKVIDSYKSMRIINVKDTDYAIVEDEDGLYGLFDFETEKLIISAKYNFIDFKEENEALIVVNNNDSYLIDLESKQLSSMFNGDIVDYNDKYLVIYEYKNYILYDYEGKEISDKADYVRLNENSYSYVDYDKLYLADMDGNKYNEEGISLLKESFDDKFIVNDKDKVVKEIFNYRVTEEENKFNIKISGDSILEDVVIDKRDLTVSKKMFKSSYYDGTLYFYADDEKTEVVGSYKCKNENSSGSLDKCNLATYNKNAKTYTLPLVNNQYVFVSDGQNINLYDLKGKKNLGVYSSIISDTAGSEGFGHANFNEVVSVNSKGKMGAISITNLVDPLISFSYDNVIRMTDLGTDHFDAYFILEKDGKYSIKTYSDDFASTEYSEEIVQYFGDTFVSVKSGSGAILYDGSNKIVDTAYGNYIISDVSDYILGFNDSSLSVYSYTSNVIKKMGDFDLIGKLFRDVASHTVVGNTITLNYSDGSKKEIVVTVLVPGESEVPQDPETDDTNGGE